MKRSQNPSPNTGFERRYRYLQRDTKWEGTFTWMLRFMCAAISIFIVLSIAFFLMNNGIDEWQENPHLREYGMRLLFAILALFSLTAAYALRGDRSIKYPKDDD